MTADAIHQFHLPSSAASAGTSSVRTTTVSRMTPTASPVAGTWTAMSLVVLADQAGIVGA